MNKDLRFLIKKNGYDFGFSLIELLVVITISTIMLGVGIMGFNSIIKDRNLKRAEKELRTFLYEAKQGAFYGKKPEDVCKIFRGNKVVVNGNNIKYASVCFNDPDVVENDTKSININNSISLTSTGGTNFIFYSVGSETKTDLGSDFGFTLSIGNNIVNINVTSEGEIR